MPRPARQKSPTGIYHVMIRGINRGYIFDTDTEKEHFLEILQGIKKDSDFELYAYALMDNHVHLLIKEASDDIGIIMKRIGIRYAAWYNGYHDRVGHLFQDRFRSEVIQDDKQFLATLRYIIRNPVKAGICKQSGDYVWSSFNEYANRDDLINASFALQLFSTNIDNQIAEFKSFIDIETDDNYLDINDDKC